MKTNLLPAAALAAALLASTGTAVLAQGTPAAPETPTTAAEESDDDGFDLGWLGLIGLAGLAGLSGRKRTTHVDTTRPRV